MKEKELFLKFNSLLKAFRGFKDFAKIKVKDRKDLQHIPFTTREDLQSFKFSDCPEKPFMIFLTTGPTGKNIPVFFSKKAYYKAIDKGIKAYRSIGIKSSDKVLNLCQNEFTSGETVNEGLKRMNVSLFPFGPPRLENLYIILDVLKKIRPSVVVGTPSSIYMVFSRIRKPMSWIDKVISTGDSFSEGFPRFIEPKIGGNLYDFYGCTEVGPIAVQKDPKDKYLRLFDEGLFIEVIKEGGRVSDAGTGKIALTDLNNYSSPIIRYLLGDEVEIVKKDAKKYIKILGRIDGYTNIKEELFSIELLIGTVKQVLRHDRFNIVVSKDRRTAQDRTTLLILQEDKDKLQEIRRAFREKTNIYVIAYTVEEIRQTNSGEPMNFVDLRKGG